MLSYWIRYLNFTRNLTLKRLFVIYADPLLTRRWKKDRFDITGIDRLKVLNYKITGSSEVWRVLWPATMTERIVEAPIFMLINM